MSKGDKEVNNKERILRDIEYINGGITAFKALCKQGGDKFMPYYEMFDEWQDILYFMIDMIEEDCENAQNT